MKVVRAFIRNFKKALEPVTNSNIFTYPVSGNRELTIMDRAMLGGF